MSQRIGIIDLGSNTARLVVMEYEPRQSFKLVDEVSENVRLAEGIGDDGLLRQAPMDRAVETLKMFSTFCKNTGVVQVITVATSATREAGNGQELLDRLGRETGLEIRILSGEQEGYYGCTAAVNSVPIGDGFVIDIGGGSTQVSAVAGRSPRASVSRPVGVVRLLDRYLRSDPVSKAELSAVDAALRAAFSGLDWFRQRHGLLLSGIGGTVRNLAKMDIKARGYPLDRVHGYVLQRERLEELTAELRRRSTRERLAIAGLNRERADVILPGALILSYLMRRSRFEALTVSGAGLREGLFFEHFLEGRQPPLFDDMRSFSILNLAQLYHYEEAHCLKVRELSLALFDQLHSLHGFGPWERELLASAALVHDIGVSVSYYDHHKHSAYLILNAPLYGWSHREQVILAMLAYAHRKGEPPLADYRLVLEHGDEERILRLASLLRLGEYLERSKGRVIRALDVSIGAEGVRVAVLSDGDAGMEIWDANRRSGLFRKAFGREITILEGA